MKTEKELLQLAAKAVGLMSKYCSAEFSDRCVYFMPFAETPDFSDQKSASVLSEPVSLVVWSPLTDDGDAFRLAVDLGIGVATGGNYANAFHFNSGHKVEDYLDDKHAATRRAIVRAAAAIGEGME